MYLKVEDCSSAFRMSSDQRLPVSQINDANRIRPASLRCTGMVWDVMIQVGRNVRNVLTMLLHLRSVGVSSGKLLTPCISDSTPAFRPLQYVPRSNEPQALP